MRRLNRLVSAMAAGALLLGLVMFAPEAADGVRKGLKIATGTALPALFDYLSHNGFGADVLEKFAYKNFLRVFEEVCG